MNPHGVTRLILSQVRLPFRHSGISEHFLLYRNPRQVSTENLYFYQNIFKMPNIITHSHKDMLCSYAFTDLRYGNASMMAAKDLLSLILSFLKASISSSNV